MTRLLAIGQLEFVIGPVDYDMRRRSKWHSFRFHKESLAFIAQGGNKNASHRSNTVESDCGRDVRNGARRMRTGKSNPFDFSTTSPEASRVFWGGNELPSLAGMGRTWRRRSHTTKIETRGGHWRRYFDSKRLE